ncbi:MAG: hypothetical protein GF313_15705 [Caldithrix sp.]|nr:hypothetical protein [Caldithrix sp.]
MHYKLMLMSLILIALHSVDKAQSSDLPLYAGDRLMGGRLALGGLYGADQGYFLVYEQGVKGQFLAPKNISTLLGLGGAIGYSYYDDDWPERRTEHSNLLLLFSGYYHLFLSQNNRLDTYVLLQGGFNIDNDRFESYSVNFADRESRDIGLTLNLGLGMRYFMDPQWSLAGELMFGAGILRLGIDYQL